MTVSGPPADFGAFVAARSAGLLRAAWLLTGDQDRAEDLLQSALALTWPRWERVVAGGNPEAYLRQVMFTQYLSWWRRRWRHEIPMLTLPDLPSGGDPADRQADRDAVARALRRLSPQQRAVAVLRFVEDQSVAQTAQLLGCSQATVKVQTGRALTVLRADPHLARAWAHEAPAHEAPAHPDRSRVPAAAAPAEGASDGW